MIAVITFKLNRSGDGRTFRRVGEPEIIAADTRDTLDKMIDALIDHAGALERIYYTIKDGRKIITRGHSL